MLIASVAACAAEAEPISYDPVSAPTTEIRPPASTAPATESTSGPVTTSEPSVSGITSESEWSDASGNLVGLDSECQNLSTMSVREESGEPVAAVALQGLWTTSDGATTWTRLGTGLTTRARSVIFDPADPERMWVGGTGTGAGVHRSDDGGRTFRQLGEPFGAGRISVDFSDPQRNTMLAVVEGTATVTASVDAGATWTNVSEALPYDYGEALAPLVLDSTTFLLGSRNGPLAGVFRTADAGRSWTQAFNGGVAGTPIVRPDGSIVWLREYGLGLIVSHDSGETWVENTGGGVFWGSDSLVELPDGKLASVGVQRVLTTDDEGESWRPLGPALPFEPNGLIYSSGDQAFYIWQFDCGFEAEYPVLPEAIMKLPVEVLGEPVAETSTPP